MDPPDSACPGNSKNKQQIAALSAAHPSLSPPPSLAPKDDKRPQTPTTRKSARKAALADVEEDAGAEHAAAQAQDGSAATPGPGPDVEMAPPQGDVPAELDPAESSSAAAVPDEAGEADDDGQASTPSRRGGRRKAGGRGGAGRRKGRGGARAATGEGTGTPASEVDGGEDTDAGVVKEEEDEGEEGAADEGEEGAAGEGGEGDEEEMEDAQRPRRGGRKARARVLVADPKKGASTFLLSLSTSRTAASSRIY